MYLERNSYSPSDVPLEPAVPLEPLVPVEPDVPLDPLDPLVPVEPDVPLEPLDPLVPLNGGLEQYGHQMEFKLLQYKDIIIQAMLIVVHHFIHTEV